MPKGKRSQEHKDLEDQLRGMILGNVRISTDSDSQDRSPRGRGRGRGFGHHHHGPPHLRQSQDFNQAQAPTSPAGPSPSFAPNGQMHSPQGQQSPQGYHGHRQQSFGQSRDFGGRGHFSGGSRGRGSASSQTLYNPNQGPQSPGKSPGMMRNPQHQHTGSANMSPNGPRNMRQPQVPPMAAFIAQCEMLDKIAEEEIPQVEMPEAEFREKDAFRSRLEATCRDEIVEAFPELAATLNLRAYGSIISGFATKGSDVDLTILWSGAAREDAEFKAQLPRVVEKAILKAGHGARLLSRTRVPIVKVCELPTEELYSALVEERQKWEELPQEEKYPELVPQPDSPTDETHPASFPQDDYKGDDQQPLEIDPDVSRNGKKMETTKRVTMNDDPLGFLQQLKSKRRTEDDDLARYCTQFINARRFAMQTSTTTDDQTFTEWFLEGLPASVTQFMAEDRAIAIQTNAAYPSLPLFEQYYEVAHPIIARLSKSKRDTNKPWLREKTLGKLDFPKQGVGIQCDINFSNPLGMHNTELLRLYSLCDPRVRPMVLFIKAWAKRRKINSAYSGTLSSYGYVLMVLHFLLNVATPPVLPNLQLIFGAKERDIQCEGFNISFHADEAHIRQMAATRQWTSNTEPLGVLLRNFFHYYAAQGPHVIGAGFNWMRDVISIRSASGLITKEGKGWTGAKTVQMDGGREVRQRYLLAIEDPFEISHNVGRPVTHNGIVTVRDEFRRVWRILAAVGRGNVPEGGLFDVVVEAGVDGEKEGDVKVEAVALSGIGAQQPLQA